jgi:hypothetical protein
MNGPDFDEIIRTVRSLAIGWRGLSNQHCLTNDKKLFKMDTKVAKVLCQYIRWATKYVGPDRFPVLKSRVEEVFREERVWEDCTIAQSGRVLV